MENKLYVGSLSYNTSEDGLKEFFAQAGKVESVNIIIDRISGRPKGFAFVEMATEEEAQEAIRSLDGKELDGRKIVIDKARPQRERSFSGPRRF